MTDRNRPTEFTHELFAAVGNETRLEILKTLWFHRRLSFSELYDRIDVGDTGHFNYHLDKLLDTLVVKSGSEYLLTNAGKDVVLTILANVDTGNPLRSPFVLDTDCYSCGSDIRAQCSGGWLKIDCDSCGKLYASFPVPVAGLRDRSPDEFLTVFDQRLRRMYALVQRGICPNCSCSMNGEIVPDAEPEPGLPFVFDHRCDHCRLEVFSLPGTGLLEDPAVIAFYDRHDVDLFTVPHWELAWLFDGDHVKVVSDDPFEYRVDVGLGDQQLRATLDETGSPLDHLLRSV